MNAQQQRRQRLLEMRGDRPLKGVNFVYPAGDEYPAGWWNRFGSSFAACWDNWYRETIERFLPMGARIFRLAVQRPGLTNNYSFGDLTTALGKLLRYMETKGCLLHLCANTNLCFHGSTLSEYQADYAQSIADTARLVAFAAQSPALAMVDPVNEIYLNYLPSIGLNHFASTAAMFTWIDQMRAAIRTAAPLVPCSFSTLGFDPGTAATEYADLDFAKYAGSVQPDYHDVHLYNRNPIDGAIFDTALARDDLPLVLGEHGGPIRNDPPQARDETLVAAKLQQQQALIAGQSRLIAANYWAASGPQSGGVGSWEDFGVIAPSGTLGDYANVTLGALRQPVGGVYTSQPWGQPRTRIRRSRGSV